MTGGGNLPAMGALLLLTGLRPEPVAMMAWLAVIAMLGVFTAVPIKRQLVNHEALPFPTGTATAETLHALLSPEARPRVGREVKLATISPVTTAAANGLGWDVAVEAAVHTWDGLVEALAAHVAGARASR